MRAILVRVGIDQSYGGWNAPIEPKSNAFVYVPIPEDARTEADPKLRTFYDAHAGDLDRFAEEHGADCRLPERLRGVPTHHDPDFGHLTYGDIATNRGSRIATLAPGDWLPFYAGLRPIRPCRHKLIYAMIGVYRVAEVLRAGEVARRRRHENAHTRMNVPTNDHLVVRADPAASGMFKSALPIGSYRAGSYRVTRRLLGDWGGLDVRDGFIQRSVRPPEFRDPERFVAWLDANHPGFAGR